MLDDKTLSTDKSSNAEGFTYLINDTVKAWERILSHDIKYLKDCPIVIADKLGYGFVKNFGDKTGMFENNKYIMKNLKNFHAFNENYPPGAENDPDAPWNQVPPDYKTEIFVDTLEDENANEFRVKIRYTYYYEKDDSIRKHITEYSHEILNNDTSYNMEHIDDDVRICIENNIGDRYYEWEC
jgi:hypothetical protein